MAVIFVWIPVLLLLYSYAVYPHILRLLARKRTLKYDVFKKEEELPSVYVLIAAYNEASIIRQKVMSILETNYPVKKFHVYIGSDASDDGTNDILMDLSTQFQNVSFVSRKQRSGKAMVLNALVNEIKVQHGLTSNDILIPTDANVLFDSNTIYELVKYFKDKSVGQVGAWVHNKLHNLQGISRQERYYIQRENTIKDNEGSVFGCMMGAFGACYAIRANCFKEIPANWLMEDFYLSMNVLSLKYKAIYNKEALCYEDIPGDIEEEFKRKRRISAGNFQNLVAYKGLLWPPFRAVAFCFFSHKILRWFGPFFLISIFMGSLVLSFGNPFYLFLFIIQGIIFSTFAWERILNKIGVQSFLLKGINYFVYMNLALLKGFFVYLKGVKSNVWQPTKRKS